MTNKTLINFFFAIEKFLYRKAEYISVISKIFYQNLLSKGVPNSKMEIIPIWADPDEIQPMEKENDFRKKHGLDKKFVVMYAGNIGHTSCLKDVLFAAEILKEQKDIQFVIVGEGVKKEALEAEKQAKALTNVLFLPFQPREIFAEMLAAADISLVTLNADSALSSLPSKIFNHMASARPILAVTPPESEIAQIIAEASCGWNVPPESPVKLAEAIVQLKAREQILIQVGQNGRACLEKNYSRNHCVDAYEKMLINICDPKITAIQEVSL